MSLRVVEKSIYVNATPQDCMTAFKTAISQLDKYSICSESAPLGIIEVDKKGSFLEAGYGENITFTVKTEGTGSNILLAVKPKGVTYLTWQSTCEKVAQKVLAAFSKQIETFFTA